MKKNPERLVFPDCGITLAHVEKAAETAYSKRHAAKILGIGESHFYRTIAKENLGHLFKSKKLKKRKVAKEELIDLARQGFTRRDIAYMLGTTTTYIKDLIKIWDIADEFTLTKGKASWVTQKGYCNG